MCSSFFRELLILSMMELGTITMTINSFIVSGDFYRLSLAFANNSESDQDVCPDLDPNRLIL